MNDMKTDEQQFKIILDMAKEMAVNTAATLKIEAHLKDLNGKTINNQEAIAAAIKETSKLKTTLILVAVVMGILQLVLQK